MAKLNQRIRSRRFSTDTSTNASAARSPSFKTMPNEGNDNTTKIERGAYNGSPTTKTHEVDDINNKSYHRSRRRQIADESTVISFQSATATTRDGDRDVLTFNSSHHLRRRNSTDHTSSNHSSDSSYILLSSSPSGKFSPKTIQKDDAVMGKTKSKQRRRSSFAKVASSVLATSRNWLSKPTSDRSSSSSNNISGSSSNNNNSMLTTSSPIGDSNHCSGSTDRQQLWYTSEQVRLHALARKMHLEENFGRAIEYWEQSLEIAEKNKYYSTISGETEVLCMLVDLHFQESKRLQLKERQYSKQRCDSSSLISGTHILSLEEELMPSKSQEKQQRQRQYSSSNGPDYHKREAQRYVQRIKSTLVQPVWLRHDVSLMDFLYEVEAWELALIVANRIMKEELDGERGDDNCKQSSEVGATINPQKVAALHFNIALLRLQGQRRNEALWHLQETIKFLREVLIDRRDMTMYLQTLQLVAAEYQQQGESMLALQSYQEQRKHAPIEQSAHISCQMAEIYISEGQLEMALEELESAHDQHHHYSNNNNSNDDNDDEEQATNKTSTMNNDNISIIRLRLLQTKGDVYWRLGRMEESMQVYKKALQETKNPAEEAKLLYIMGRLNICMGRTRDAITYFTHELEITQRELGAHHLSVSVIYQSIASLFEDLSDYKMGIYYYNKALKIELAVMQDLHSSVTSCTQCDTRMCDVHTNIHSQVPGQIRETKKNLGRIHFKLGDFDGALKASLGNDQF
mmetsp:Transcript_21681/g.24194  ORF Transcript_21681/g.24194 Transcript_21681/m.24194 type:complete len:744 (+) Transcript_21681:117-2348(+)